MEKQKNMPGKGNTQNRSNTQNFAELSDAELKKIAGGGKLSASEVAGHVELARLQGTSDADINQWKANMKADGNID